MKKGITDLISVIILLLITVALAGVAYTFLQGFLYPQVTKAFIIPTGGGYCSNGKLLIYAINTGYQSDILTPDDWIVATVTFDGTLHDITTNCDSPIGPECGLTGSTVATGESGLVVNYDCDDTGSIASCPGGTNYNVDLGTTSGIQHITVFCS